MFFSPEPSLDADDAPLPDGDLVAAPVPSGAPLTLRFASAYEPWLSLAGRRVVEERGPEQQTALLWLSRRLPALYRALDLNRGLRARLSDGAVVVTDLVSLDDDSTADHGTMQTILEGAQVKMPAFAVLGASVSRHELAGRVRGLYAAGTPLEIRIEDQGRVVSRRRLRVGRTG